MRSFAVLLLSCVSRSYSHKAFLARGIVFWKADGRATGVSFRVMRRGLGCLRQSEEDFSFDGPSIKIVCVGDAKTGKTSFVRSFVLGDEVLPEPNLPVEAPSVTRCCVINKEMDLPLLKVTLCDLPTDESIRKGMCYPGMDVALLFFCDAASLASCEAWLRDIREYVQQRVILVESKVEGNGVGDELRAQAAALAEQVGALLVQVPKREGKKRLFSFFS